MAVDAPAGEAVTGDTSDEDVDEVEAPDALALPSLPWRPIAAWAAVVALVAAIGGIGYLTWDRTRGEEPASFADAPVEVASASARDFFTLDHRTIEDDMERVLATATGEFEQQYEKQSAELRRTVENKRLVLAATVPDEGTAVEHLGEDEAWVLVSVDVRTESDGTAAEDTRYRTRLVLTRSDDGEWLVSRFEQVG